MDLDDVVGWLGWVGVGDGGIRRRGRSTQYESVMCLPKPPSTTSRIFFRFPGRLTTSSSTSESHSLRFLSDRVGWGLIQHMELMEWWKTACLLCWSVGLTVDLGHFDILVPSSRVWLLVEILQSRCLQKLLGCI